MLVLLVVALLFWLDSIGVDSIRAIRPEKCDFFLYLPKSSMGTMMLGNRSHDGREYDSSACGSNYMIVSYFRI